MEADLSKLSIKELKKLRRYHRQHREQDVHNTAFHITDRMIKKKQAKFKPAVQIHTPKATSQEVFKAFNELMKFK